MLRGGVKREGSCHSARNHARAVAEIKVKKPEISAVEGTTEALM